MHNQNKKYFKVQKLYAFRQTIRSPNQNSKNLLNHKRLDLLKLSCNHPSHKTKQNKRIRETVVVLYNKLAK